MSSDLFCPASGPHGFSFFPRPVTVWVCVCVWRFSFCYFCSPSARSPVSWPPKPPPTRFLLITSRIFGFIISLSGSLSPPQWVVLGKIARFRPDSWNPRSGQAADSFLFSFLRFGWVRVGLAWFGLVLTAPPIHPRTHLDHPPPAMFVCTFITMLASRSLGHVLWLVYVCRYIWWNLKYDVILQQPALDLLEYPGSN